MYVSEQIKWGDHALSLFCGENKTFVPSPVEETIFVPLYYAKHIYHTLDLHLLIWRIQLNDLI